MVEIRIVTSIASLSLIACGIAGCDRGGLPSTGATPEPNVRRLQDVAPALYEVSACGSSSPQSLRSGQVFDYQILGADGKIDQAVTRRQTIGAVNGDLASFSDGFLVGGVAVAPPDQRQARFGFLPTATPASSIRYEDASQALSDLRPGQSATIRMTETMTSSPGQPATADATVTFVGCGRSASVVSGAPNEPVRVYRLQLPQSSLDAPGRFTETTEYEYLISETTGWPIAERTPTGPTVLIASSG